MEKNNEEKYAWLDNPADQLDPIIPDDDFIESNKDNND